MLDKASCRDWPAQINARSEGFKVYKNHLNELLGVPQGIYAATLTTQQIRNAGKAFDNTREAVGDDIDIAVHVHGELDAPSSIMIAQVVESMNPFFHQGWLIYAEVQTFVF